MALLAILTGCSSIDLVRESPPPEFLRDCPHPAKDVKTNGGIAKSLKAYERALTLCNIDKASLREWAKEL